MDRDAAEKMITIRLTQKEKEEIEALAKRQRQSVKGFILWLVDTFKAKNPL
jgi:uncharacterized protein (DUF1778 family)